MRCVSSINIMGRIGHTGVQRPETETGERLLRSEDDLADAAFLRQLLRLPNLR